jgi:hypothetical protein
VRVLLITQHYAPEVTAAVARVGAFAEGLAERGHDVEVVVPHGNELAGHRGAATLRAVLAAFEAQYGARAVRAANIVACREIEQSAQSGLWFVQSETDPTNTYFVLYVPQFGIWTCNCKDCVQRGGPCKHALAVQMWQACERREAERDAAQVPIPFPTRAYTDDARFELTPLGEAALAGQEPNPAA